MTVRRPHPKWCNASGPEPNKNLGPEGKLLFFTHVFAAKKHTHVTIFFLDLRPTGPAWTLRKKTQLRSKNTTRTKFRVYPSSAFAKNKRKKTRAAEKNVQLTRDGAFREESESCEKTHHPHFFFFFFFFFCHSPWMVGTVGGRRSHPRRTSESCRCGGDRCARTRAGCPCSGRRSSSAGPAGTRTRRPGLAAGTVVSPGQAWWTPRRIQQDSAYLRWIYGQVHQKPCFHDQLRKKQPELWTA